MDLRATQVGEWWRKVRAADGTPTLAGLKNASRPVAASLVVVPERRSIAVLNDEHREALRARGYANHTLRQRKMLGSWLASFE